jgi:hypothetical protein
MKNQGLIKIQFIFLSLILALFAPHCFAGEGNQIFFTLEIDGNKVGYQKMEWALKNGSPYFSEETLLEVVHGKSRSTIKHGFSIWQKPGSQDLYFIKNIDAGTLQQHREGRIQNNRIQLKNSRGIYSDTGSTLPADAVFPSSQLQWYLGTNLSVDAALEFNYFDPLRLSAIPIRVSSCAEKTSIVPGSRCRLRAYRSGPLQNREYWLFDSKGEVLSIESNVDGIAMVKKPCFADCINSVEKPWDFIGRLVVASPYKISEKAALGKINYLISSKSGRALSFLDAAEQSTSMLGGKNIVSVCANCKMHERANILLDEKYLKANIWVQSDNREIRRLALSAVSRKASVKTRMLVLVKLTQNKMQGASSYVGYSTALDALHSGSGDCSEFALLLAAFARAQGIPTRVVFGMAYSSRFTGRTNVFSPHAWVQVWEQRRWVSYDAALNKFDATHIALAASDGNPQEVIEAFNQLSDIKIEKAAAITAEQ